MVDDICVICGRQKPRRNKYFCSNKCMGLGKQGYKICPVCGKNFKSSSYVCCSPECSRKHRSDLHATGVYDESIKKMRKGFRGKVDDMDSEDFWKSKGWVIKSPSGQIYDVRNLMNFTENIQNCLTGHPARRLMDSQKSRPAGRGNVKIHPIHGRGGN